ncbi:MAG: phosphatase PAP2 family protein [Vicingus serpentipes]|nr:phosphatase PAP2 family protein [Vicingus serpentipes]
MKQKIKNNLLKSLLTLLVFHFSIICCVAQSDSSFIEPKNKRPFYQTKGFKIAALPTVLITSGALCIDSYRYTIKAKRDKNYPNFENHTDDYIQYAPLVATYLIGWATESKNDFINKTILLAKAELLNAVIVHSFKRTTGVERPDGSNMHSFPSGHTAGTFVAATFMHKELGHKSILYSIAGYSVAASVGVLRIMNDKHWVSDVLVGAGIGILSTNLVYYTHQYRWGNKKDNEVTLLPTYQNGNVGLFFAYTF